MKKRDEQLAQKLKAILDQLAVNPQQDAHALLWPIDTGQQTSCDEQVKGAFTFSLTESIHGRVFQRLASTHN